MHTVLAVMYFGGLGLVAFAALAGPRPSPAGASAEDGRRNGWLARRRVTLTTFLQRAGLRGVTPRDFLVVSLLLAGVAGVLAQVALGWAVVSLLAAAAGASVPVAYYARRHDRRRTALQVALVESIDRLRDSLRTGLSIDDAIVALARTGPEALRGEWAAVARDQRLRGFAPAVVAMQQRLADAVFDTCALALTLADAVGGEKVSQVLDRLAQATRAELLLADELRAARARHVTAAKIIAGLPLLVLVVLRWLDPAYVAVFDTPEGQLLLLGCLASTAVGYAGMRWITRVPPEPRVLTGGLDV